jgi:pSer/pThr/pTyr-binding forkhead associated (FHA) protein
MEPIVLDDAPPTPVAAAVPVPRLVRADGSVVMLGDGATRIGREAGNDVVLDGGGSVSRQHAAIETAGGQATLSDLGSTNGTFVNGQRVSGPVVLSPGDSVMFGSEAFRYEA